MLMRDRSAWTTLEGKLGENVGKATDHKHGAIVWVAVIGKLDPTELEQVLASMALG